MIAEFFVGIFTWVSLSREKKPKNLQSVSWITAKILYLKSFLYTDFIKWLISGYVNTALHEFSTGWKFLRLGVLFTRNQLNRTKI